MPKQVVGAYGYKVTSINDPKYGLSKFTSNEIKVIYDKVTEGGATSNSVTPGQSVTVWFKVVYEYNIEQFNNSPECSLSVNGELATWSASNQRWEIQVTSSEANVKSFRVTGIQDMKYQLTSFTDAANPVSVEWKQAGIPSYPLGSLILAMLLAAALLKLRRS